MAFRFCSLASGSSGNCQYIESEDTRLLLDAGFSGKKVQSLLDSIDIDPLSIDGILVTHEHSDHIKGVGILSRRFNIPIYANEGTWRGMEASIGNIKDQNIRLIKSNTEFEIKNIGISAFDISHDSLEPVSYSFQNKNKKISVVTDTGRYDESMKSYLKDSDLLMVESNHDPDMLRVGSYPQFLKRRVLSSKGHLSNEDAGNLIKQLNLKESTKVILGHLSGENNFPELAYQTVQNILVEAGMETLSPELTYRDRPTKIYNI